MDRDALVATFAVFPDRLTMAVTAAVEATLAAVDRPAEAGEWGPREVVRHLIAVEAEVWQSRLARVAAEDDPQWPWTEPGLASGFDETPVDGIVAAFAAARATTVATVLALDDAGWARHGTHSIYGRLDVEGLLRIAIDHDAEHLEAISRT